MAKYINPICGKEYECNDCELDVCKHHPRRKVHLKPPLGLTPKKQWIWLRYIEILEAITRYASENKVANKEWIEELEEIRALLEDTDYGNKTTD